jgi:M6 family metalloprotease-like protein
MKKLIVSALTGYFIVGTAAYAIAPAKPGVAVPQVILERARRDGELFYPKPMLANTMARYAQARRAALQIGSNPDEVDEIYAFAPVICGKYSDSGPDDWPVSLMQTQLFDGPWPTGTMREFYEEISFDQFHLDGTVYGWYTSTLPQAYVVGSGYGMGPDAHLDEFLLELLDYTDPTTDFSLYDSDGPDGIPNSGDDDGIVDACFFIHDGAGAEAGANNIWSHSFNLQYLTGSMYTTNDPRVGGGFIRIGPYIIQPSITMTGEIIEIGVFCHEYGHALGLPDLYDTDYSSEGIGVWGLMGGGSWNTPAKPAHMIAWCRYKLGWINPTVVTDWLHDQPLPAIETTGAAYRLWTNGSGGPQYFMVENRRRYGFDVNLRGEGLLIWHVDETAQQTNENHPKVDLEEADGMDHLRYNMNSGDNGDPFPGITDNRWFDEYTNPNSLDYFNYTTQVAVWNISDAADTMRANLDVVYSQPRLQFMNYSVSDPTGNGDNRADPGETVNLWITLQNLWGGSEELTGILRTDSAYAQAVDSLASFGIIATHGFGNNQSDPFQIAVSPDAPQGAWLSLTVRITSGSEFEQEISFAIQIGRAPILLVDDDLNQNYEQYLAASIAETGINYEVWDVSQQGTPGDQAIHYGTIVWITGNDFSTTLEDYDIEILQQFLNAGRTLILSGQNINEDIGGSSFFAEYLKCTPRTDDVTTLTVNGVVGNPLTEGMNLFIFGVGGAANQSSPSSVYPIPPAQPLFAYPNGEVAAVYYHNETTGAHVAYFGFGLEAVSGIAGSTSRTTVLNVLFDWAGVTAVQPEIPPRRTTPAEYQLSKAYPNPFNPSTRWQFSLPTANQVMLSVFDIQGRRVADPVNGRLEAGTYVMEFDGSRLPSGVYLYRLQAGDFTASGKMVLLK